MRFENGVTAHIILASGSPRRAELLRRIGIETFGVVVPQADESCPGGLAPEETVLHIARAKSAAASRLCAPDDLTIAADTMVFLDGRRLGKPRDGEDAVRMLTALCGRRHTVCTGVALRQADKEKCFAVSTDVWFREADEAELRDYVRSGEPMDKAGAYGIQCLGSLLVERIEGDFYNVMGLPVLPLSEALKGFGVILLG